MSCIIAGRAMPCLPLALLVRGIYIVMCMYLYFDRNSFIDSENVGASQATIANIQRPLTLYPACCAVSR